MNYCTIGIPIEWKIEAGLVFLFLFFITLRGVYRTVKKRDEKIRSLKVLLDNRKIKDELALKIRNLYEQYKQRPVEYDVGKFCEEIVLLLDNTGTVSEALLDEFRHPIPQQVLFPPSLDKKIQNLMVILRYANEEHEESIYYG